MNDPRYDSKPLENTINAETDQINDLDDEAYVRASIKQDTDKEYSGGERK